MKWIQLHDTNKNAPTIKYIFLTYENIIKNESFKAKTKLDMLLLVEWVSSHKSLKRVIDTCSKSIVNKKLLKKFHKLGISVEPLPCRSSLPEPFNLPELIYKFADAKKV